MTLALAFLLVAFGLILALMPLARGAPLLVLSRIETLKVSILRRPIYRMRKRRTGLWASISIMSLSRTPARSGFSLAAGGLAA